MSRPPQRPGPCSRAGRRRSRSRRPAPRRPARCCVGAAGGGVWRRQRHGQEAEVGRVQRGDSLQRDRLDRVRPERHDRQDGLRRHRRAERLERLRGRRRPVQVADGGQTWTLRLRQRRADGALRGQPVLADVPGRHRPLDRRASRSIRPTPTTSSSAPPSPGTASSSVNGGRFTPPGARAGRPLRVDRRRRELHARADPSRRTPSIRRRRPAATSSAAASRTSRSTRRRATSTRLVVRLRPVPALAGAGRRHRLPPDVRFAGGGTVGTLVDLADGVLARAERRGAAHLRRRHRRTARPRDFYTVANANVPAATLVTGGTNGGWTKLSNSDQRHAGLRLVQLLRRAVLVRHAGLLPARAPGRGLHRRRDAVRRDLPATDPSARTAVRSSARRTTGGTSPT